jgi:hypothetical protein
MRALAASGDSSEAVDRAAQVFVDRRVFRRRSTGEVIRRDFVTLHYPLYWHYDALAGLVGLAEAGCLSDPRRAEALDLLESKRLPDGGWPAEARYYRAVAGRSAQVAPTWTGEESTGDAPTRG